MDIGVYIFLLLVKDIELFQCDGEEWVCFWLVIKEVDGLVFEYKLVCIGKIKNCVDNCSGEDEDEDCLSECLVIDLQVCLGGVMKIIEVNFIDCSVFNYLFLMGIKGLCKFYVVVDFFECFVVDKFICK